MLEILGFMLIAFSLGLGVGHYAGYGKGRETSRRVGRPE